MNKTIFKVLIMLILLLLPSVITAKDNYKVTIGNWVGSRTEYCHSYSQKGNTYQLFDDKKQLVLEITISDGVYVFITPIKEALQ